MADEHSEKKEDLDRAIRRIQEMIDRLRVTEASIKSGSEIESILVGGEWLKLAKVFPVFTFYNEKIADVALAERDVLNAAVEHAYAAREIVSSLPLIERANLLLSCLKMFSARRDDVARLNSKITGIPLRHSLGQLDVALEFFGEIARQVVPGEQKTFFEHGKQKMVVEESAGVLAAFVYSDSAILDASILIAISIATMTPLILLPSKQNSLVLLKLGKSALESGVPPSLVSVICGEEAEFIEEVAGNKRVATVLYSGLESGAAVIGSVVGKGLKKIHVETPKKDLFIVCEDHQIDQSAEDLATHLVERTCPTVAFVEHGIFDAFVSILEDKIKALEKGDPLSPKASFRVFGEEALAEFRGGVNAVGKKHRFGVQIDRQFMPAIYAGGEFDAELVRKVKDFPAAVIFRSTNLGYALHYAKNLKVKNASVYTNNIKNAFAAIRDLNADTVSVNSGPTTSYEEWLKLASKKKKINLGGLALQ